MAFIDRLRFHASHQREKAAVVTGDLTLSYGDLLDCVSRTATELQRHGFTAADVVGVNLDDEVENLVVCLALMAIGADQVTLASHDPDLLRETIAARVSATNVIGPEDLPKIFDRAWLSKGRKAEPHDLDPARITTLYFRTSGTTGDIKIVPLTEEQVGAHSQRCLELSTERLLRLASIEHNNSKRHRLYCVWVGGTNVFRPKGGFDLVSFALKHDVTCLEVARMHLADIVTLEGASRLSHIKLRAAGSLIPYEVRREIEEKVTTEFQVRYAATECGTISAAGPGQHDEDQTAGCLKDGVELEIVDDFGRPLPARQSGQIRLRAPGIATGYLNAPEETARQFRDGWFYPGDIGFFRDDGQLVVQGRSDDMFILNGLNIFPAEIERVLENHPNVRCAAALGLPSKIHGHIPVAAVEVREATASAPAELRTFAKAALGLRAPRRILVLESLPRNSQGKIAKRLLLPLFSAPS